MGKVLSKVDKARGIPESRSTNSTTPATKPQSSQATTTTDSQVTLTGLAAKITELSETLTKSLTENNVPLCTFDVDSPATYATPSPDIYMQRQKLIETAMDLIYLSQGPNESIFNYAHNVSFLSTSTLASSDRFCKGHARCRLSQRPQLLQLLGRGTTGWISLLRRHRKTHQPTPRRRHSFRKTRDNPSDFRRDGAWKDIFANQALLPLSTTGSLQGSESPTHHDSRTFGWTVDGSALCSGKV